MDAQNLVSETVSKTVSNTFNLKLGSLNLTLMYWQAVVIVFLIFLLFLTFARIRYLYVHWSIGKNATAFLFWGFLLALVLEGFLILGGRTVLTEVIGWKNAPKPLNTVLDEGRERLISVLGITKEIPESVASETPTAESVAKDYKQLSKEEMSKLRGIICEPK